tara:strand:+ start:109 stop:321 length:213 start_codon:yes stop_codon:yes gene_type:complete
VSDLTICTTTVCPIRNGCYRFIAEPEQYWQSYNDFYESESLDCLYFIKETNEVEVRQKAIQTVAAFFRNL